MTTAPATSESTQAVNAVVIAGAAPCSADSFLRLRQELGLSQAEFGEALQVPRSTVANYETGRTEWRRIHRKVAIPLLREYLEARHKRHMAALEIPPNADFSDRAGEARRS